MVFPLSSYLISVPFVMSVQLLVSIGVGLEGAVASDWSRAIK